MRLLKVVKDKNKLTRYLNELLKLGGSFENLFFSILAIILFCHVAACIWYLQSSIRELTDQTVWTIRLGVQDDSNFEVI